MVTTEQSYRHFITTKTNCQEEEETTLTEKQLEIFRENIDHLMVAEKISQRKLAADIGISRTSLSRILCGERRITVEALQAISKRFGRKMDDLINKRLFEN